jgi:hypothetical protein
VKKEEEKHRNNAAIKKPALPAQRVIAVIFAAATWLRRADLLPTRVTSRTVKSTFVGRVSRVSIFLPRLVRMSLPACAMSRKAKALIEISRFITLRILIPLSWTTLSKTC